MVEPQPSAQVTTNVSQDRDDRDGEETKIQTSSHTSAADLENNAQNLPKKTSETDEPILTDQTNLLPFKQLITVFLALSTTTMLAFLDQTIVSTALPVISSDLGDGKLSSYVATSYLLASTAMQPIYGRLSDIAGRKSVLIAGLVVFTVSSLACALSKTMIQLIVFRAFQGVGGGSILTLVLVIIGDVVSLRDRGKYSGIIEIIIAISNGIGPTIGGVLADTAGWAWCFWINLPISAFCIAVIWKYLPQNQVHGSAKEKLKRIDWGGSLLTTVASILLLLPLNWGGVTLPWSSPTVIATLVVGGFLTVAFVFYEWKIPRLPIIPMRLFRIPTICGVYIATTNNGMVYYISIYFIPQLLQVARGKSALVSGYLVLPLICPPAFVVWTTGYAISKGWVDMRIPILVGFALASVGFGLLSTVTQNSSIAKLAGYEVLAGIGLGCTFQNTLVAAQSAASRADMAVATGVRNWVRSVGSVIGLAVATTIVNTNLRSSLKNLSEAQVSAILDDPTAIWKDNNPLNLTATETEAVISAYVGGFSHTFYLLAALCATSFVACALLVQKQSLDRQDDKLLKDEAKKRLSEKKELKAAKKLGGV